MCGLFGAVSLDGSRLDAGFLDELEAHFLRNLSHRGPDGNGFYISDSGTIAMGHVRLSVIDIIGGAQPIFDDQQSVVVTLNGEIYNYIELRSALSYGYRTSSDTEVFLVNYLKNGVSGFSKLNGMYAFAIHDQRNEEVIFGVDPLSIKSLYVFESSEMLIYSSELTPLAKFLIYKAELFYDIEAIRDHFFFGNFVGDKTAFKSIRKLTPGELLRIGFENGAAKRSISSKIIYEVDAAADSKNESLFSLDSIIGSAVKRQLRSDVPVSLFLSGGVDSTVLANYASKLSDELNYQCISFPENHDLDESNKALEVARRNNVKLDLILLKEMSASDLKEALYYTDEPICDPAVIPLMKLSKVASKTSKVCLLGDGGDELFYGYTHHKFWKYKIFFARLGKVLPVVNRLAEAISYKFELYQTGLLNRIGIFLKLVNPYMPGYSAFSNCRFMFKDSIDPVPLDSIDKLHAFELSNVLSRKLLQKTDRITMRFSIEARVPLLDLEIDRKSREFQFENELGKQSLKALVDYKNLSSQFQKKQGFRVPLREWLSDELLLELQELMESSPLINEVFHKAVLDKMVRDQISGRRDNTSRLFALYEFLYWLQRVWEND